MKNESFGRMVVQLSEEAEQERVDEARLMARQARRDRIRQSVISAVVVLLYVIVYFKRAEVNDTVAMLFSTKEPEYQSISKLSAEVDADVSNADGTSSESTDRNGKLKNALKKAKQNAALVDDIMNDAPGAVPAAPAVKKK